MRKPDFFMVGAPKCGTTAMYVHLREHPGIFMPYVKDVLFFGSDMRRRDGRSAVHPREEHLELFEHVRAGQIAGDACVWYLKSENAAREIKEFNPDASIIIMLRNPVDVIYSLHSRVLYEGDENVKDFAEALALEPERAQDRHVPPGNKFPWTLQYREAVRFSGQVARYLDVFGRDKVHIILFDDFVADFRPVLADTLRFLKVDENYIPPARNINPNKELRSLSLRAFLRRPPAVVSWLSRRLIPTAARMWLHERLISLNTVERSRRPMTPQLRETLQEEFASEVTTLGRIIGRDLSA